MFRATQCSSSGESIISIHHLVYITLCRWPSGLQVRDLQTVRPPTQSDIYQMMYWYNWFPWWWALGCSKHVRKWNKHIKKSASIWLLTGIVKYRVGPLYITWYFYVPRVLKTGVHQFSIYLGDTRNSRLQSGDTSLVPYGELTNIRRYNCTLWS